MALRRYPGLVLGLVLGLYVLGLPARATAKVAPAEDRVYGGVYAAACNDVNALRVRLYGDVMTVERAVKALAARPFKSSKTIASGAAPPAFKIAYVGEFKGGDGLVFVMTHDASGLFVTLDGGPKSLALLGPRLQGQKLRHCDPNRNALPGTPAPKWMAPSELLRDPKFKTAYLKAQGQLSREPWLATLSGPAPELVTLRVAGTEMQPGNPSAPRAVELDNLWRQQWRSGK